MALAAPSRRRPVAVRRVGYAVSAAVIVATLFAVNVWPGWAVLPFLTDEMNEVLGLVNLSLVASLAVNAVYLVDDAPWLRSLGDLVTTGIGLVVLVRMLQVFPFDVVGSSTDWSVVVRVLLVVAIVGSAIGIVAALVGLLRGLLSSGADSQH